MNVNGRHFRTIWTPEEGLVRIIDQRFLPHRFVEEDLTTTEAAAIATTCPHKTCRMCEGLA